MVCLCEWGLGGVSKRQKLSKLTKMVSKFGFCGDFVVILRRGWEWFVDLKKSNSLS